MSSVSGNNDDIVVSPKTSLPFNFGQASTRDQIIYTCERPGGDLPNVSKIKPEPCKNHIEFLRENGIAIVLILLDDNEMDHYEEPGLLKMYEEAGIRWHRQPMGNEKAATNIMKLLQDCKEQDEKVVVHCTHGMGRSGRVAAGWLVTFYGLSPEAATQEVMEYAEKHGIQRLGSVRQLVNWLKV